MTKAEQREFIASLMDSMKTTLLAKVERVPDAWDGFELRQLIADHVAENAAYITMDRKRARAYHNTVLVQNL